MTTARRSSRRSSKRRSSKRRSSRRLVSNAAETNVITLERIDDVDALLSAPGRYQTTSTFPAYVVAKTLDGWHPLFRGGMDMPFVEGNIFFFEILSEPKREIYLPAFPPDEVISDSERLQANPLVAMGVSPDFWTKLLERYPNWELGWWREVAQNSRDAGATQFDWSIVPGTYKDPETGLTTDAMVVTAYDNGVGMDADILRRALLTRGGSVKPEEAVGGFGDAKNLILFPWLGWKVETRNLVAFGQHESVMEPPGIETVPNPIQGTRITVWMPLTQTTAETYAQQLLGRSYLPGVRVRVNGKTVAADLIGGEEVSKVGIADSEGRTVGEIVARHQRNARANKGIYVRARGVYMFQEWGGDDIPGVVYVDVNAPAKLVFDASRNAVIGAARSFVGRLKERLAKEPEAVLRSKKWKADKVYRGTGAIEVREGKAAEVAAKIVAKHAAQMAKRQEQKKPPSAADAKQMAEDVGQEIEQEERNETPPTTPEEETAQRMKSSRETASRLVRHAAAQAATTEQVATAVRYAMWKPDLYMANQMPFWKPPAGLEPETMAAKYIVLLRAWTEACKFGLNVLGEFRPFGVGFIMMLDGYNKLPVLGAYQHYEGTDWLMINPLKFERGQYDYDAHEHVWTSAGDRLDLATDEGVEELCSTAVHEITHLQGFRDHDSGFASQLTRNMKIAHRGMLGLVKEQLKTIRSETRARFAEIKREKAAAKPRAPKAETQPAEPWDVILGRVGLFLRYHLGTGRIDRQDAERLDKYVDVWAREATSDRESIALAQRADDLLGYDPSNPDDQFHYSANVPAKTVLKLHDVFMPESLKADAAAGGNEMKGMTILSRDDARKIARLWNKPPADPRSKAPSSPKATLEPPKGTHVFSWERGGKGWTLRKGYIGQGGEELASIPGGTDWVTIQALRGDDTERLIRNWYGRAWPGDDNVYVWLPEEETNEWRLRVRQIGASGRTLISALPGWIADPVIVLKLTAAGATVNTIRSGNYTGPTITGVGAFRTAAEAQDYVMNEIRKTSP